MTNPKTDPSGGQVSPTRYDSTKREGDDSIIEVFGGQTRQQAFVERWMARHCVGWLDYRDIVQTTGDLDSVIPYATYVESQVTAANEIFDAMLAAEAAKEEVQSDETLC